MIINNRRTIQISAHPQRVKSSGNSSNSFDQSSLPLLYAPLLYNTHYSPLSHKTTHEQPRDGKTKQRRRSSPGERPPHRNHALATCTTYISAHKHILLQLYSSLRAKLKKEKAMCSADSPGVYIASQRERKREDDEVARTRLSERTHALLLLPPPPRQQHLLLLLLLLRRRRQRRRPRPLARRRARQSQSSTSRRSEKSAQPPPAAVRGLYTPYIIHTRIIVVHLINLYHTGE